MSETETIDKEYCVFCANGPADTRDHLPPRSFFPEKLSSTVISPLSVVPKHFCIPLQDEPIDPVLEQLERIFRQPGALWGLTSQLRCFHFRFGRSN
jgi:hypothetical protein